MQSPERIPFSKIVAYGVGIFGWSISINIVSVMLLYLYLPPSNSGMVNLVPQIIFFGVINIIALVTASGRLFDAVVDPLIAGWSDRSHHPRGRRIPFMLAAIVPMTIFMMLMFLPVYHHESKWNLVWLGFIQLAYYFFFGMYVIPFNALLAELGHYPNGKMHLSTAQSVGFIIGMVVSSAAPALANVLRDMLPAISVLRSNQYAIWLLTAFGGLCMFAPVLFIDERRYVKPGKSTTRAFQSLKMALGNANFRIFALADASYFMAIGIITSGLLYYIKALLLLPESFGTWMMALMVFVTLLFFPLVNVLEKKFSKKKTLIMAFYIMMVVFGGVYNLGRYPASAQVQVIILMLAYAVPFSFLGILQPTIVADIAEADAKATGENREGMFFGMRALFQKFGQTAGVMVFAMLTLYGKDPGHDLGLRLSGVVGAVLCLFAGTIYTRYKE